MKILLFVAVGLAVLILVLWLGSRVRPRPFEPFDAPTSAQASVAVPETLPEPVARFYEELYGGEVPRVTSAVISGRGRMRVAGITFPARFRFTHDAGRAYRHYIELTLYGLPIMRVNETYLDGHARLELPFGVTENAPQIDQAANLALWAESIWLPPVLLTAPSARWEAVDETSALLVVPFGEEEERLLFRFDEDTGLPRFSTSMRYREADSDRKSLWINEVRAWGEVNGRTVPTLAAVAWYEDGAPWAVLDVEEVVYDADVSRYVRSRGP